MHVQYTCKYIVMFVGGCALPNMHTDYTHTHTKNKKQTKKKTHTHTQTHKHTRMHTCITLKVAEYSHNKYKDICPHTST